MAKAVTLESLRKDIQQDIRNGIDDVLGVVKDLAQATSDGFERVDNRFDKLEKHAESVDKTLSNHTITLRDHTARFDQIDITLRDHTMRFAQIQLSLDEIIAKQEAHHNDIVEIYLILQKHEKHQKISDAELTDTKLRLQRLVAWAQATSKTLNIPIKL